MTYTEGQILDAIQWKYRKFPMIRQIGIYDPFEIAFRDEDKRIRYPRIYGEPTGLEFPEGWVPGGDSYIRIVDGLLFDNQRTAIEVKVSRADFKKDTAVKRRAWQHYTHRFIYVTPVGLVDPKEVPVGCGLWEYDGKNLIVKKRASVKKDVPEWPAQFITSLIWRVSKAEAKLRQIAKALPPKARKSRSKRK